MRVFHVINNEDLFWISRIQAQLKHNYYTIAMIATRRQAVLRSCDTSQAQDEKHDLY